MKFGKKKESRKSSIRPGRRIETTNYYRPGSGNKKDSKLRAEKVGPGETNKQSRFSMQKVTNYILIAGSLILVVYATTLSLSPDILISKDSYRYRETSEYSDAATQLLKDSFINRSKILFRSSSFEESLLSSFPEIDRVEALVPLGGRDLTVAIRVSDPFAVVSSGQQSGVVNTSGTLITGVTPSDELVQLRFATPQSNFDPGAKLLTEQEVHLLQLLDREISQMQLESYKDISLGEVLFNVLNGQFEANIDGAPFYIKISTYANAEEQVGGFRATLQQLDRAGSLPKEYIDVRVPGRVFIL